MSRPSGWTGISLFAGAGIGDIGFRAAGIDFIAMCEMEPDRAALLQLNFPRARHFPIDIYGAEQPLLNTVSSTIQERNEELFLIACTAPCQGMSKSGQGTLLKNIREGRRPRLDPRNRLILPALRIVSALRPLWVVLENVLEMRDTVILDDRERPRRILDIIDEALRPGYCGTAYDVEFADYGVPQRRQRLITVYTRSAPAREHFRTGGALIPAPTHSRHLSNGRKKWVSVTEALAGFSALEAIAGKECSGEIPFHRVPVLDPKKYEWVRRTPPGQSAFDNQCANPDCGFEGNPAHGNVRGGDGINRARKDTPLYCVKCGSLLPRPYTVLPDGRKRIMSGYTSAYKRMAPDLPAPALTRNLSFPCSDHKIHPRENRVLSLAEAMTLQTIVDYEYAWGPIEYRNGSKAVRRDVATDTLMRLVIGESVPPRFLELLGEHIKALTVGDSGGKSRLANIVPASQFALWSSPQL